MVFSYSGLRNHPKASLPMVVGWSTSANIARDPPRSIHTRKIDKVGQDSALTQTIDESGDRISEMIRVYAKGKNPHVSVQYNNSGSGVQASLPYKINRDGAFRFPIRAPMSEHALSRLPRTHTSVAGIKTDVLNTLRIYSDCNKKPIIPDLLKTVGTAGNKTYSVYNPIRENNMTALNHIYEGKIGKRRLLRLNDQLGSAADLSGKAYPLRYTPLDEMTQKTGIVDSVLKKGGILGARGVAAGHGLNSDLIHDLSSDGRKAVSEQVLRLQSVDAHAVHPYGLNSDLIHDLSSDGRKALNEQVLRLQSVDAHAVHPYGLNSDLIHDLSSDGRKALNEQVLRLQSVGAHAVHPYGGQRHIVDDLIDKIKLRESFVVRDINAGTFGGGIEHQAKRHTTVNNKKTDGRRINVTIPNTYYGKSYSGATFDGSKPTVNTLKLTRNTPLNIAIPTLLNVSRFDPFVAERRNSEARSKDLRALRAVTRPGGIVS
jgi:hypothetical protein